MRFIFRSIKFSTVESLSSSQNVTIICGCAIEQILHDGKRATHIRTSNKKVVSIRDSKLILAMSSIPNTTLVLNSFEPKDFPQLKNVGKRFTAHTVSSLIGRIPRTNLLKSDEGNDIELGALYINGREKQAHYHLQLSAVAYRQSTDRSRIYHVLKERAANSIPIECIEEDSAHVVVSCSTLGELDYKNKKNQFNLAQNHTSLLDNGELNIILNDQDKELWNRMDTTTFELLEKMSLFPTDESKLEFWHEDNQSWSKNRPSSESMRKRVLVHDASTMWIGDDNDLDAPVGSDYCLRGINNVYITGAALWPTGGSCNPVVTITAMAMHLADKLSSIY